MKSFSPFSEIGSVSFDNKGEFKNGALTLQTIKGGKLTKLAVIR